MACNPTRAVVKWKREPFGIWPVCCWIPSFWPPFCGCYLGSLGLQAFFFSFFVQICCVQQSCTPVRGSALIQWVPNPLAHQGKPASTWSSKGQHVLMENFLSFEPACSYPRIKQNFTHGELPFLWASLFISLNQAEFCSWLKTFSIRFYCTVGTKSCDSFSVLRQSLLLT